MAVAPTIMERAESDTMDEGIAKVALEELQEVMDTLNISGTNTKHRLEPKWATFMDLPAELRNIIYSYTLVTKCWIHAKFKHKGKKLEFCDICTHWIKENSEGDGIWDSDSSSCGYHEVKMLGSLARINSQVRQESRSFFYANNSFALKYRVGYPKRKVNRSVGFLTTIKEDGRTALRHIDFGKFDAVPPVHSKFSVHDYCAARGYPVPKQPMSEVKYFRSLLYECKATCTLAIELYADQRDMIAFPTGNCLGERKEDWGRFVGFFRAFHELEHLSLQITTTTKRVWECEQREVEVNGAFRAAMTEGLEI